MNKQRILKEGIPLVIGNLILAFGVSFFIIPNNILTGGVTGLAIALSPWLNIDIKIIIATISLFTFMLGLFFLGKEFALKTIVSSVLYPLLISIFSQFKFGTEVDPLLASLYGGLFVGAGVGMVFRVGASTGGMDIPPLILSSKTKIKTHVWIMGFDSLIIALGLTSLGLNSVLIGFISTWTTSRMIDFVQTFGGEQTKQVLIITDYVEEILEMILKSIDRGATLIDAHGGYTRQKRYIIMTVLLTSQYAQLEKLVKEIDNDAFLIVSNATEVHGNGFYRS